MPLYLLGLSSPHLSDIGPGHTGLILIRVWLKCKYAWHMDLREAQEPRCTKVSLWVYYGKFPWTGLTGIQLECVILAVYMQWVTLVCANIRFAFPNKLAHKLAAKYHGWEGCVQAGLRSAVLGIAVFVTAAAVIEETHLQVHPALQPGSTEEEEEEEITN